MMDFAAERARIRAKEEYGVKTNRDWNRYYEEWDKAHPLRAIVRRAAFWLFALFVLILAWAPLWVPAYQLARRMF